MHMLAISSGALDDLIAPVDLGQPPADMLALSFTDSDLTGLAVAWSAEAAYLPSLRLAHLRDLRHPMSVDLWIERVGRHAKAILVRLLGGYEWWPYGIAQLSRMARSHGIALAVLPGEERDDPQLAAASTISAAQQRQLLDYFRENGAENLRAALRLLARHAGATLDVPAPRREPRLTGYLPRQGAIGFEALVAQLPRDRPVVPLVFYRSALLAGDTAPIDALHDALAARGLAAIPLALTSLKSAEDAAFLRQALERLLPAAIVATTGFAASTAPGERTPFDVTDAPVLQAAIATTSHASWQLNPRGLGASDLAMNVVLPELDGRILLGAMAFKGALPTGTDLAYTARASLPVADRVALIADRVAGWCRLRALPRVERRIAVLMPDYPGAAGRSGYAVGLDVPGSVVALLADLAVAGYAINDVPPTANALIGAVERGSAEARLALARYEELLSHVALEAVAGIYEAWGAPCDDPDVTDAAFRFRTIRCGNVFIALPPDRGSSRDRRADYHDPSLPPRHALVAFGLWLRHEARVDAVVHMGAHGTLEWLPGKAVALTAGCFPEVVLGALPVIYPFIVSNPGEAAQAKRRLAAVTIGHLPPPLIAAGLSEEASELERLVDEYVQADGLDRRRRERLARLILDSAARSGLAREAGIDDTGGDDEALRRIDAWLCDLKDLAIKDGQHIFGRAPQGEISDPAWPASAEAERKALLAALDGRRIRPGPSGAPHRGRRDVLPTGRNLYTADPRTLPTPTAFELGQRAADEIIRNHLQEHGEMPRALVIDLWGSATLRTGGEEIAQGLALMGCRPIWDAATGRVTGIEVLPPVAIGRERVDVTWRISGLFRDLFPMQIAMFDIAVRTVAARDESDADNPLAVVHRAGGSLARVFGTAPGAYGAGAGALLGGAAERDTSGAAYLAAASHAYSGADGEATDMPGGFAALVATADLLVHPGDNPDRDLLEGSGDVGFVGGFAAAAASLGRAPDLIMLDLTDPQRPRARRLDRALARIVRSRAVNPRFIAGQMRHGARGAAEFAETVDRLVDFAQTTGAVSDELFDLIYDAYLGDAAVRDFLLRENPAAARAIADRLAGAQRDALWHPRRNDIAPVLTALQKAAT